MKKLLFVLAVLVLATPVFAQGPFNDVPTDHWAYDAVNKLQQDGALIGYPDGTFSGKRSVTRYEFATAIARVLTMFPNIPAMDEFVKKGELPAPFDPTGLVKSEDLPDFEKFASKGDVDQVKKLVDEFKDELAALGVDVDALKRDVAALDARVAALEAAAKRVTWTGGVNVFAVSPKNNYANTAFDLDDRTLPTGTGLLQDISVVKDFDLNIVGRVNDCTTANATINYGNYLNYLVFVDEVAGGTRPTTGQNQMLSRSGGWGGQDSLSDTFFPYYLYIDTVLGKGAVTAGRFPLQFTPYTLKKIDVDSYTSILKTDDGNYPVDGIKTAYNCFGVDLTLFAAKHDTNDFLLYGLAGQSAAGIGALNQVFQEESDQGGNSVGGLQGLITQSAGGRATFGIPFGGNMGLTYYQAYSADSNNDIYDQARVFGADMSILLWEKYNLVGSWTRSDALAKDGVDAANIDENNVAWDAKVVTGLGKLGIGAGFKNIGRNFTAAGSWDKIGRWINPTNVKGPYADFTYPIQSNLKLVLNGEYLTWLQDTNAEGLTSQFGMKDDKIIKAEAGVKYGLSKTNSLTAGYQMVKWDPDNSRDAATESYLTLGWAHQMGANAGLNVGYQFISYDDGNNSAGPYAGDYRGGLGVVQFGVSF